ncbi:MAG: hypothetical protein A2796_00705 [Chlamydiae bacterium RIFCSPHIGHO2_01_FULL_44_39]|nr:MAG: hypothetical protein A2796_00705 [Chlamydiae bacterium RIFCSPHIGHO2_01_FULL_44_39]OGN59346.1 MAG: hypothetical protein A3C42_05850 [Chlamydiae bacterium RIFCSPHIGHO2_02_FULL_45_9]
MSTGKKIQRILRVFLVFFLLICLRIWHLGVIQREERLQEAEKPQQKTLLIRADRGVIVDRFGIPLAVNRISYNAAIYYAQIAEIPRISWQTGPDRKQVKIFLRKEYIQSLSKILASTLQLNVDRIEDLIHSKAALFPHVPYIIKASLSESEYYQLRMLEKDWPGISAEIAQLRHYPLGKTGSAIIGTMGAINPKEYARIAQEMSELQAASDYFEQEDQDRLKELKEKAYAIHDLIGKTGIEAQHEEALRGVWGKKTFEVDQKGRFIREISRKEPISGKQITLSLSSELQEFAEKLLRLDERTRDGRSRGYDPADKTRKIQKQPWIKGGAIVAMDPNTGEVIAMASHPRFDPNDFIYTKDSIFNVGKTSQMNRWLENSSFIGSLWDGIEVLERERSTEEIQAISWDFFLETLFDKDKPIYKFFEKMNVGKAVQIQEDYEAMLYFHREGLKVPIEIQKRLDALFLPKEDLPFAVDLARTVVYAPAFTDALLVQIGSMPIAQYRTLCQTFLKTERAARIKAKEAFRNNEFKQWRALHEKMFLEEKRKEEKEKKSYARPFIDYLDKKENELFQTFWEENKFLQLASPEMPEDLIRTFRSFSELTRPLLGNYKTLRHRSHQTEQDMAASFYPVGGYGFNRSYAFQSGVPPGSVFKLVTAYEALFQNIAFQMLDETSQKGVGKTLGGQLYPRYYKGGRLPKSASRNMGKIDLTTAIERSSNPYFAILAGDYFHDPEDLLKAAKLFGYGQKTGIDLPHENKGNVPNDLKINRTGLYSTSIGQHTLLTTPLQTAAMLTSIANGGLFLKPTIVKKITDHTMAQEHELCMQSIREIPMDAKIQRTLLEAMDLVVSGVKGSARPSAIRGLLAHPNILREYIDLKHHMVAKTGTAEIMGKLSYNPSSSPQIYKYTWFAAASFAEPHYQSPELVVVVFLRYGDSGKELAPLASQMIYKWREILKNSSK